jgi:hypothetical protein
MSEAYLLLHYEAQLGHQAQTGFPSLLMYPDSIFGPFFVPQGFRYEFLTHNNMCCDDSKAGCE